MKQENKKLIADVLFRELENEFYYENNSMHYIKLKEAYTEFIMKHFKGFEQLAYIVELKDFEEK